MKKLTTKGKFVIILTTTILVIALCFALYGDDFNQNLENKTSTIKWEEVNLRESPSIDSEIITTLGKGEQIIFTGKTHQYSDPAYPYDYWLEVETDNYTGWIIAKSANL